MGAPSLFIVKYVLYKLLLPDDSTMPGSRGCMPQAGGSGAVGLAVELAVSATRQGAR